MIDIVEELAVGPRETQHRGPQRLEPECACGGPEPRVELRGASEKQAVLCHGVIDPGAREDHPVVAAEGRDHDGERHEAISRRLAEHRRTAAVATRRFCRGLCDGPAGRKRREIRHVGEQVEEDDAQDPAPHGEPEIARRVLHLAGGEADVVPGIHRATRTPPWRPRSRARNERGSRPRARTPPRSWRRRRRRSARWPAPARSRRRARRS